MAFKPDIIVTHGDVHELVLVVDVRQHLADLEAVELGLRRYMSGTRCPLGMLVTPQTLRLYRDRYTGDGKGPVELVGEYSVEGLFAPDLANATRASAAQRDFELEDTVQSWLEQLTDGRERARLPRSLREGIEAHVLPALEESEISAAHIRWRPTGT